MLQPMIENIAMFYTQAPFFFQTFIFNIFKIYDAKGYENKEVLNEFIISNIGHVNYKYLAAGIVEYKKALKPIKLKKQSFFQRLKKKTLNT